MRYENMRQQVAILILSKGVHNTDKIIKTVMIYASCINETDTAIVDALDLLSSDMHTIGTRPCSTCAVISQVTGKLFGCSTRNGYRLPASEEDV